MPLILPSRFTRQPQYAAQIDMSAPMGAQKWALIYVPAVALYGSANPVARFKAGAVLDVNQSGRTLSQTGTGVRDSGLSFGSNAGLQLSTSSGVVVFKDMATSSSVSNPLFYTYAEGSSGGFYVDILNHQVRLLKANVVAFAVSSNSSVDGQICKLAWSYNGTTGRYRIAFNGVLTSGTSAQSFTHGEVVTAGYSTFTGTSTYPTQVSLLAVSPDECLSDQALIQISNNPWQIFKAPARDIWVSTGAGGSTYSLPATTGAFVETPVAANLKVGKVISNTSASYSVSPTSTVFKATRNSSAITSAFVVNGITTNLKFGRDVGCSTASYNITPTAATLERGYKTSPAVAIYTLTATAPNLVKGWNLSATTNSYALSANTEQNNLTRCVVASTASYAATSVPVVLTKTTARTVSATTAILVVSSQAATLTKVGIAKVLSAATQAVSVSGNNGNLFVGRGIVSAAASSTLASNDVAMRVSRRAQAIVANISVLQNTTTLSRGRTLQLSTATLLIAANNASFGSGKSLAITPAHTVVTSNLVDLRYVHYVNTARTSTVAGERRTLGVAAENNTVLVHRENRTALAA